jgi:hypothetical protein
MIYGAIFYTLGSDENKVRRLANNVKARSREACFITTNRVWLTVKSLAANSKGAFRFDIHPGVKVRFIADLAEGGAPRLDFVAWLGHAGPGYLSAHEGSAVGPVQIENMRLILPPKKDATAQMRHDARKIESELAERKNNVKKMRKIDNKMRAYINLAQVAEIFALAKPLVIHICACNFGTPGTTENLGWPWKATSGPRQLGSEIGRQVHDVVPYVAAMTYSVTDTGMQSDWVPGDPGSDQGHCIIVDSAATESSGKDAIARVAQQRQFIADGTNGQRHLEVPRQ